MTKLGKIIRPDQVELYWEMTKTTDHPAWPTISIADTVVVDFNGVLDQYAGWNGYIQDYPPADGAENFLINLRETFNTIIICSATPYRHVYRWLRQYGLLDKVDFITNIKLPAAVYVDDRATRFWGDFEDCLYQSEQALKHGAWWQQRGVNTGRQ